MAPPITLRKKIISKKSILPRTALRKRRISAKSILSRQPPLIPPTIRFKANFGSFLNPIILSPLPALKAYDAEEEEMTSLSGSSMKSGLTKQSFSKQDRLGDPSLVEDNPDLLLCEFVIVKYSISSLHEEKELFSVYVEEDEDQVDVLEGVCKLVIIEFDQKYITKKLNSLVGYNTSTPSPEISFGERLYHCTTTAMDRTPATARLKFRAFSAPFPHSHLKLSDVYDYQCYTPFCS